MQNMEPFEEEIIRNCKKGDFSRFRELYDSYSIEAGSQEVTVNFTVVYEIR